MPVLYLVACAAPPAMSLHEGVRVLREAGWDVWVTCTPDSTAGFETALILCGDAGACLPLC